MSEQSDTAHSLIVYFRYPSDDLDPIYALEDILATAIEDAGAGEYDGHEVALLEGDDAFLFMYGPDADALLAVVQPLLEGSPLLKGARATLRYGPPDDVACGERHVVIGA